MSKTLARPSTTASIPQATGKHVATLLQATATETCRALHVDRSWVLLPDAVDPTVLVLTAGEGIDARLLDTRTTVDDGPAGDVIAGGEPVLIEGTAWAPIRWRGVVHGVLVAASDDSARPLGGRDLELVAGFAGLAGTAVEHAMVREGLEGTLQAGIEALTSLVNLRDGYTGVHSGHVAAMALRVGKQLGLSGSDLVELGVAGRLHDIGKIGVPDGILRKSGPLTPAERSMVECHAAWGAETLERVPGLERIAEIVGSHHERWDGRGYPAGLAGAAIPLASRIIGVCDALGAMTSDRPYRRALALPEAVRLLLAGAGAQFDTRVVGAVCNVLDDGGLRPALPEVTAIARKRKPAKRRPDPARSSRLAKALDRLEDLPALSESRTRLLALLGEDDLAMNDIVVTIESDPGLALTMLRAANRLPGPRRGKIRAVPAALRALSRSAIEELAAGVTTFEFFQHGTRCKSREGFRLHAVATQHAAAHLARDFKPERRDGIIVAALLHDVGKLVLADTYPEYPAGVHRDAKTPEDRVRAEQLELGIDHALVGGALIRRWGLPGNLAKAVEQHHAVSESKDAAVVRVADLLTHYVQGHPISPRELEGSSAAIGLAPVDLRSLMFELPLPRIVEPRAHEHSTLSGQETRAVQGLAAGKVYKEIALDLGIKTSTVRSHLHRCYVKLGAVDRAQAVLIATDKGWI
jgi:putative nucleotidyltransferase with HDIG domain